MKNFKINNLLWVLIFSLLIINNAYSEKIINTKKINEYNYNYLEIVVEQNYNGEKQYSTKDLPLAAGKSYRWEINESSSECSSTCGTGVEIAEVICVESLGSDEIVVDNSKCEEKLGVYVVSQKICSDWSGCNASYAYTEWDPCNPENVQTRTATCVDNNNSAIPEIACEGVPKNALEQSCQYIGITCKDMLNEYPSTVTGYYNMSPDGTGPYNVYCNMDYKGGGWMNIVVSVDSAQILSESPTTSNPGYLKKDIMVKFAQKAFQVAIKQNDSNNSIVSTLNSHPIVSLRSGLDMAEVNSSNNIYWTSDQGLATAAKLSRTCGPKVNYPWLLWTCGNNNGIIINQNFGMWNCNYNGSNCAGTKFSYTAMIR